MSLQDIDIVAVTGKQALNQFVELPFRICAAESHWVPPLRIAVKELLDRKKHPFYKNADAEFFLARRNGRVVGRIAAVVDRAHNRFHNEEACGTSDERALCKAGKRLRLAVSESMLAVGRRQRLVNRKKIDRRSE